MTPKVTRFVLTSMLFLSAASFTLAQTNQTLSQVVSTLQIKDGALQFQDMYQFSNIRFAIEQSSTEDLMAWQQQIGFVSSNYAYNQALNAVCCQDLTVEQWEQIKHSFEGTANVDVENFEVSPKVELSGTCGWIANAQGEFWIGNGLCKVTNGHVFSILDGSRTKLAQAEASLQSDEGNGVFVIPYYLPLNAPEISDCSAIICTTETVGNKRVKDAASVMTFEYYVGQTAQGPLPIAYFSHRLFALHQRRSLWVWSVCQRTRWTYNAKATIKVNIPPTIPPSAASPSNGGSVNINWTGTTAGEVCKFQIDKAFLILNGVSLEQAKSIGVCYSLNEFSITALDSGITAGCRCTASCR